MDPVISRILTSDGSSETPSPCLLQDRLLTHGLGLFETMLAVGGKIIHPHYHRERLVAACKRLSMTPPDWEQALQEIYSYLPGTGHYRVRLTQSSGSSGSGSPATLSGKNPITLFSLAPAPTIPKSVTVLTAPWKHDENSALAGLKCTSYADSLLALRHARAHGADNLIFLNNRNHCSEAATANLFVISEGKLLTPPLNSGCLPGTTRRWILESFSTICEEQDLTLTQAQEADAAFLSSSLSGPVPIARWDEHSFLKSDLFYEVQVAWKRYIAAAD